MSCTVVIWMVLDDRLQELQRLCCAIWLKVRVEPHADIGKNAWMFWLIMDLVVQTIVDRKGLIF